MTRHKPPLFVIALAIVLGLTGCVNQPVVVVPSPTAAPQPAVAAIDQVLQAPQEWSGRTLELIAPVFHSEQERVLTLGPMEADQVEPTAQNSIWLAEPLPQSVQAKLGQGRTMLRLQGKLSPPGAYGQDQRYSYQFSATQVEVLQPERSTIANLALNPHALDRILLQLSGTLLVQSDTVLLVDRVASGGVPLADAQQLKLPPDAVGDAIRERLQSSGAVRWGKVEVLGWWQDGKLIPLQIDVEPKR